MLGLILHSWGDIEGRLALSSYDGDLWDEPLDRALNIVFALWTDHMDPKQTSEFRKKLRGEGIEVSATNSARTGWDRQRAAAANASNPAVAELLRKRQET